jgi:hypothetical protein
VGTAFVFKIDESKSRVISWARPACEQPTCRMVVDRNPNGKEGIYTVHSISLRPVRDDRVNGLLFGTLSEEMCNSVPKFEAAPSGNTGSQLFMVSRHTKCGGCPGLIISKMSKRCPVENKNNVYARKSGRCFKSFPIGAPLVNGEDKLVAVVTGFKDKKLTVLGVDNLSNVLLN